MSFPMPGFHVFSQDKYLSDIFSWWNNVHDCPITRGTLEWIIPAPLNHNGWHKDMVRPQLKAFVLLGDVDLDTAPMYYAKRSHFIQNDFEKQVAFRMFKEGTLSKANYLPRRGNHYPAAVGAHSGFLSDDEAKNDPEEINDLPINLGGVKYEKFVCTGSLGDVIFFDSCGFHSGNISHGKIRRTISLSAPSVRSDVAIAFDEQNAKSV
jgi:hypothetical protein